MTKTIYLDQNKWIDLAKAFYNRDDGEKFKPILKLLTNKVNNGEVILPISIVHLMETATNENIERRQRLAEFMVELSKGFGIVPYLNVRNFEIENAILKRIGEPEKYNIYDIAIGKGLSYSVGVDLKNYFQQDELNTLREQLNLNPKLIARFMIDLLNRDIIKEINQEDIESLNDYENSRQEKHDKYSKEMRLRIGLAEMAEGILIPRIVGKLNQMGRNVKQFVDEFKGIDQWKDFFFSMPTLDLWVNLHVIRDNDLNRKVHKNDLKDIGFLSIAVPYCDIIVIEKYWGNILNSNKYGQKYNCDILTDLTKLWELIES